jgi:hypothetical protein
VTLHTVPFAFVRGKVFLNVENDCLIFSKIDYFVIKGFSLNILFCKKKNTYQALLQCAFLGSDLQSIVIDKTEGLGDALPVNT